VKSVLIIILTISIITEEQNGDHFTGGTNSAVHSPALHEFCIHCVSKKGLKYICLRHGHITDAYKFFSILVSLQSYSM